MVLLVFTKTDINQFFSASRDFRGSGSLGFSRRRRLSKIMARRWKQSRQLRGPGGKLNGHLMARCVRNIITKNYQNLVTGFQVTIENVGDVFLGHRVYWQTQKTWLLWHRKRETDRQTETNTHTLLNKQNAFPLVITTASLYSKNLKSMIN